MRLIKIPTQHIVMSNLGLGSCTAARVSVYGVGYRDQPLLKTQGVCQLDVSVRLNFVNKPHFTINGADKPSLCLRPGLFYRFNQNTLDNQNNPLNFSGSPDDPRAPLPREIELLYFVSGNRVNRDQYEFSINNYLQDNTYYIEFRVPEFARSTVFYYWSSNNPGMGNAIRIGGVRQPCKRGEQDLIPCGRFARANNRLAPLQRMVPNRRVSYRQPVSYGHNWPLPGAPKPGNNI